MVNVTAALVGIGIVAAAVTLGAATTGAPAGSVRGGPGPIGSDRPAYVLPLAGEPVVAAKFEAPAATWAAGHRGVDLLGTAGQPVLAPAGGTVSFAGTVVDRGVLTITHPDGLRSSLEPVQGSVAAGAGVWQGQVVGTLQPVPGHCAPATCLHWGVRRADTYLDPLLLVRAFGPVVLLPDP